MLSNNEFLGKIVDKFAWMESQMMRVGTIFLNPRDILRLPTDQFDKTTHKEHLAIGIHGSLWGADVIASDVVPDGHAALAPAGMRATIEDADACMLVETP